MGYDVNTEPPREWFCGHVYLKEAKRSFDAIVSSAEASFDDITSCIAARLNILRGIRVAVKLTPEDFDAEDRMWAGLDGRIGADRLARLKCAYRDDFKYTIGGTYQYGVCNFWINTVGGDSDSDVSVATPEGKALLSVVVGERLLALGQLMELVKEVFFWDCYVPGKQDDIHYYDIRDGMDDDEILNKLVEFGFAEDYEDAEVRWRDRVESDRYCLGGDVDAAFAKWNEETFWDWATDGFWEREEDDAIRISFSD
ncbi:MAG: hypothetical protein JSS41_01695 [Proteobacteria bacterium]|nr:hypothetical protein [Pseudomonadota bacterium]